MEQKETMLLEGLLPVDIWNAIIVLFILFGVAIVILKGVAFIRDEIHKAKEKKALNARDFTDDIADKVMDKLTPQIDTKFSEFSKNFDKKFEDIDTKLSSDREELRSHTTQLNDHERRVGRLEGGNRALCHGMLALLERDPALLNAQRAMQSYLINGEYKEEDWKVN